MAIFDPTSALLGGLLIGIASALLMVLNGRVAGISGILGGALAGSVADTAWRLAFLAGLIAAPILMIGVGRSVRVGWWSSLRVSWSASEPVSAAAAHPVTACAESHGYRRDRSPQPPFSWPARSRWWRSPVTALEGEAWSP